MKTLIAVTFLLVGCTPSIYLRNPVTGDNEKCGDHNALFAFYKVAFDNKCVRDLRAQGYMVVDLDDDKHLSNRVKPAQHWECVYREGDTKRIVDQPYPCASVGEPGKQDFLDK
jgi:hypothetical protein